MCDGKCDETCTNSRIYVSNLPANATAEELVELFSSIGLVARERPKGRGVFKDQVRVLCKPLCSTFGLRCCSLADVCGRNCDMQCVLAVALARDMQAMQPLAYHAFPHIERRCRTK